MPLLRLEQPETKSAPVRLSATFFNGSGHRSLFIRENEWIVFSDSWDAEFKSGTLTVRQAKRDIALRLIIDHEIGLIVERLDMYCAGYKLVGNAAELVVTNPGGGSTKFTNCIVDNCAVGLSLN